MKIFLVVRSGPFSGSFENVRAFYDKDAASDFAKEMIERLPNEQKPSFDQWGHCGGILFLVNEVEMGYPGQIELDESIYSPETPIWGTIAAMLAISMLVPVLIGFTFYACAKGL